MRTPRLPKSSIFDLRLIDHAARSAVRRQDRGFWRADLDARSQRQVESFDESYLDSAAIFVEPEIDMVFRVPARPRASGSRFEWTIDLGQFFTRCAQADRPPADAFNYFVVGHLRRGFGRSRAFRRRPSPARMAATGARSWRGGRR